MDSRAVPTFFQGSCFKALRLGFRVEGLSCRAYRVYGRPGTPQNPVINKGAHGPYATPRNVGNR